jgi:hypothetical protein
MSSKSRIILSLSILILLLYFSSCVDNKIIVYSDNKYTPILPVETIQYKSPQERQGQDPKNTLGIAISGGGSRAQYFGLGVLIGLDQIKKDSTTFLKEIDYFSTVSGGGFAAGYYLSLTKNEVLKNRTFLDFWQSVDRKDILQEFLYKGAHESAIIKLRRYERNLIVKSYPRMIDEELLQLGKEYNDKIIDRLFLSDFFIPRTSPERVLLPLFVTNGTIYNNGERLPFMPHIIDSLKIIGSLLPVQQFEIDNGYGLPLSYAIAGSAAFPGILPMLKLSVSNSDKEVIRVIDGGAVDNLGYKTLFELLGSDKENNKRKGALIVNCSGFGVHEQQIEKDRVGIKKLLTKSLLYAVDINLLNSKTEIPIFAQENDIDYEIIGFHTLKERYFEIVKNADPQTNSYLDCLKESIYSEDTDWEDLYKILADRKAFVGHTVHNLSEIPIDRFKEFDVIDVFALYELSAQVKTKIKIYPWEKEALVLAGRYAVFLKELQIKNLLN